MPTDSTRATSAFSRRTALGGGVAAAALSLGNLNSTAAQDATLQTSP